MYEDDPINTLATIRHAGGHSTIVRLARGSGFTFVEIVRLDVEQNVKVRLPIPPDSLPALVDALRHAQRLTCGVTDEERKQASSSGKKTAGKNPFRR